MGTRPGGIGNENWFERSDMSAEQELALEVADERLPWLESDEDETENVGFDTGRLIGLGLILLVALVGLVSAIWFVTNRGFGSGPAPDGSLIIAPDTPYKARPVDPGGKTFAGTGDTSYAVGAGRAVEGRLATARPAPSAAPAPVASQLPDVSAPVEQKSSPPAASELPIGTAVQIGAYSNRNDAEAGWRRLSGQTDVLDGVSYRIFAGRADIGTVYRLQAVGGDKAGARELCNRLKASGIACQVK